MTTNLPAVLDDRYEIDRRPLSRGGRADWAVRSTTEVDAGETSSFVELMREFIAAFDDEISKHKGDPIATGQALARWEAILADIKMMRDHLRDETASSLRQLSIRYLTIDGVCTVEGTGAIKRSNWQHARLLAEVTKSFKVISPDGEVMTGESFGDFLLTVFRPDWRLTPLRELGIEPNDYCDVATDDDGKPVSTPSVKMVDNHIRSET